MTYVYLTDADGATSAIAAAKALRAVRVDAEVEGADLLSCGHLLQQLDGDAPVLVLAVDDPDAAALAAKTLTDNGLSVRLSDHPAEDDAPAPAVAEATDADLAAEIEAAASTALVILAHVKGDPTQAFSLAAGLARNSDGRAEGPHNARVSALLLNTFSDGTERAAG